jgi:hypothetical protein
MRGSDDHQEREYTDDLGENYSDKTVTISEILSRGAY